MRLAMTRRCAASSSPETAVGNAANPNAPSMEDLGEQQQTGTPTQGRVHFRFADAQKPGVYVLEFFPRPKPAPSQAPSSGSSLSTSTRRAKATCCAASRDEVEKSAATGKFYVYGADKLGSGAAEQAKRPVRRAVVVLAVPARPLAGTSAGGAFELPSARRAGAGTRGYSAPIEIGIRANRRR